MEDMALELYGKNIICTRENGTVAFELADSELFYMTGFKVIQNFPGGGLLSAYRTRLNGRIRLVFDVDELVSVTSLIDKMTPDQFCMMMLSLVSLCERMLRRRHDICGPLDLAGQADICASQARSRSYGAAGQL